MLSANLIGFLGADAKETAKGWTFSVSTKKKINNETVTQWVSCFMNYNNKVVEYLKSGTMVYVTGDLTVGVYKKSETEYIPSISMAVSKIELINSKAGNKNE